MASMPLAARMRPTAFSDFIGQDHLLKQSPLKHAVESGHLHSMILWGPPGCGKTSLAKLIASVCDATLISLSAVMAGVKDIRAAVDAAMAQKNESGRATILLIDEIHRFNKAQQDALLPFVEDGTVFLIGATTENPSFEINHALLSRCRLYVLKPLTPHDLKTIFLNALAHEAPEAKVHLKDEIIDSLILASDGDARRMLTLLEVALQQITKGVLPANDSNWLSKLMSQSYRRFDKKGDEFYEQISALHKAVRGSSPDGAVYWLCRMLDGGCCPTYIARRIVRMASEDIGNADPRALTLALNAWDMIERLGEPEGHLGLAQAVIYLACAPKSVAVYEAFQAAMKDVRAQPSLGVPLHLRNAPTKVMKNMGYGKDYRYDPHEVGGLSQGQTYFPPELGELCYYAPKESGLEIKIKEKLDRIRER